MPRYIAFLRAINVGGHTVKMDHLRRLFETLGFSNVETFIASGNVIFDTPTTYTRSLEQQIEGHLQQSLGYAVTTFLRTPSEVAAIAHYHPFSAADLTVDGHALYIAFLTTVPTQADHDKLLTFRNDVDDFHVHEREVYWLARRQMQASTFSGAFLEKTLGLPATLRNVTTVRKLAAKYSP
jgi:uncharacterized protein (DUF1697 family)